MSVIYTAHPVPEVIIFIGHNPSFDLGAHLTVKIRRYLCAEHVTHYALLLSDPYRNKMIARLEINIKVFK